MSTEEIPPPPKPPWYEQPGPFSGGVPSADWTGGGWANALQNAAQAQGAGRYIPGVPNYTNLLPQTPVNPEDLIKGRAGSGKQMVSPTTDISFEEYLASRGLGGGGGGGRPDFSGYRNALMGQADELNARIQAMYNQLAAQAGENMGRVQEIYGGAQEGVGSIYDSAAGNIQQAYGSAQEQAADQLARLGIEAAAPAVIDPMALSQAQAVSGLETGRAGGLSALGRYGSTAQDFGSQMAQVAQQQGTEMNAAILASLQNRLAESLAAEQGGGGGGGGGMSVSDTLKLQDAYRRDVQGELPLDERRFALDVAQAAARPANEYAQWKRDKFVELTTPQRGAKPLYTPEQAQAYLDALDSYVSPR
jgi:hypothetical protein